MKTLFNQHEVKAFFQKKLAEMEGEQILMQTIDIENVNPLEALDASFKLGQKAGEILGKLEMLHDLEKLFEL